MRFNRVAIRNRNSEILTANLKTKDATFSPAERPRRYFAAFFLLESARRSIFFRRFARFLALSLPWLFPIRPQLSPTCRAVAMRRRILRRFQAVSFNSAPASLCGTRAVPQLRDHSPHSLLPGKKHPPQKRMPATGTSNGRRSYLFGFVPARLRRPNKSLSVESTRGASLVNTFR